MAENIMYVKKLETESPVQLEFLKPIGFRKIKTRLLLSHYDRQWFRFQFHMLSTSKKKKNK